MYQFLTTDGYRTRSHLRGEGKVPPPLAGLKGCSLPRQGKHGTGSMMAEAYADLPMSWSPESGETGPGIRAGLTFPFLQKGPTS